MAVVLALDAGTTGIRAMAIDETGQPVAWAYREFPQHFPRPGWVEHDASDIWDATQATLADVVAALDGTAIAAIGITNQRETAVAWDRRTGAPKHRAIVWQDRRTAVQCDQFRAAGHLDAIRERTGLVLDAYFSATKWEWMVTEGGVTTDGQLALGTVDSWVIWNLTSGGAFVTDPSNASRTLAYDIEQRAWSDELCELFGVPRHALPEVCVSSGDIAKVGAGMPIPEGTPICGIAGDQQAALFGQVCFAPGEAKNTYGTGSFVLLNAGSTPPPRAEGLLTTVAWELERPARFTYALEGAIFVTGAAIQWLRDGLGIIKDAAEVGPLAESIPDTEGVYFVPALTGLGSPQWDPYARGTIVGLTRGSGRAHLARAVVESMAYATRDVVEAMSACAGVDLRGLRADGGASVMDLLMQIQADQLNVPVTRPSIQETTILGAAYLAGLGAGVWSSLDEIKGLWKEEARFEPVASRSGPDARHAGWQRAVDRSRNWARPD
ncbi:MAG TPA: glycerol kinase GlpK [Acidimicrobiales bacterium]|nr:glycerol kinase GlpK [Acidimicrobiales bacterium]